MKGKNDMSKTENKDALLQTAFNNAQTIFQSQVGIFRTADKNIQNVRNVLILTLLVAQIYLILVDAVSLFF